MKLVQKLGPAAMSVTYVVAGILLLLLPNTSVKTFVYATAGVISLVGLLHTIGFLLRKHPKTDGLSRGLLFLGAGVYMALTPEQIGTLLPTLLAFVVLASGCSLLQEALVRHRARDAKAAVLAGIGAAVLVWAVVLLINPFAAGAMQYRMTGIGLTAAGAAQLAVQLALKKKT